MTNRAMKPRPGPMRQDGDFYTRQNSRNINNISIKGRGLSLSRFKVDPESTVRSINSLKIITGGTENKEASRIARREAFHKRFSGSKKFRFNEQTGLVEEKPQK